MNKKNKRIKCNERKKIQLFTKQNLPNTTQRSPPISN